MLTRVLENSANTLKLRLSSTMAFFSAILVLSMAVVAAIPPFWLFRFVIAPLMFFLAAYVFWSAEVIWFTLNRSSNSLLVEFRNWLGAGRATTYPLTQLQGLSLETKISTDTTGEPEGKTYRLLLCLHNQNPIPLRQHYDAGLKDKQLAIHLVEQFLNHKPDF